MISWSEFWASQVALYFLGSKIPANGDCSHEIKRRLLLGRKVMTNLDRILKSKDITLSAKVCLVKAMVFPVVRYRCESWTVKKAEQRGIDAFELWCWKRLLRVPWTARRSNQSILKEISLEYLLEELMLKLELQHFGHLMWRSDSLENNPDAGKDGRREEKGATEYEMVGWHHWLKGHSRNWWWTERPGVLQSMGSERVRHDWAPELNWGDASGSEPACQCRIQKRCGLDSWVRKIPWRRAWQPTPVLLSGESHGQRSLVCCGHWGHTESDILKQLSMHAWSEFTFPKMIFSFNI